MYYILKTAEEKRAILLDAMEKWISGVMTHVGDRVDAWDVINEPINDGDNGWRGIDGVFNGEDTEPVETTETGLTLNWASNTGNQHWYWGYYIGKDYGVKAFEYARKYAPNAKLFVNDYNLETSPNKLTALIDFVKYIDEHGTVKVDGIGTQMHVNVNITKAQVDAMFKTLAATGKLIRITELDVAFGVEEGSTITPSAAQLQTQSDVYQMIITSYLENIPAPQQSAITIWTLSDNKKEHEYWLTGDAPNIFDSTYVRKTAYKGVCDAIAGKDLSEEMKGEQWKDLH
jgi:GH35 family endo-1,4-beta-xylanase